MVKPKYAKQRNKIKQQVIYYYILLLYQSELLTEDRPTVSGERVLLEQTGWEFI